MIELQFVNARYYVSNSIQYVKSLTINSGEFVGILGENGSGKTSLLKAIMGIGETHDYEVRIEGRTVKELYDRIAFVTEEGTFLPDLTPGDYGEFLAEFFPRFDRAYYDQLVNAYELPEKRKIRTFSKGQKLSLEICAGLAKRADYLLMDEPFVGKDIFSRRDSVNQIVSGLSGRETVLLTTHLIDEIENVVDRAIILHRGLIRADFYIDDMRERGLTIADVMQLVRDSNTPEPFRWPIG
ncbi:ABC transporter ATP-binding protein [Cohnella lubricantis]|uniref:ABC transporter ATP-binding protein n=1 Tax=Cohnella lubricantis TaxID=2163172 RepID=A0A841T398_9BACL|nr:ABC transporter ATP-binding protein [Cohnella lubricantis]MBB6676063.1 ABC transporter ATP-binding protein [Cohnella lubricantis]MBP2118018.1 ABC-2 type transport system ATP-binding protein [Cohnella lubricantis]